MERKEWGNDRAAYDRSVIATQSLPFRGAVGDIADVVAFLLSAESRFVTGHEVLVNGGAYMG
jgi:NAD(P)-dependent dehydrogenase (short-subunit alcohol dehydrogenase family)